MAFTVTSGLSNGYRCCCQRTWEAEPEHCETLADALFWFPATPTTGHRLETLWVEVTNDATGEVVARGDLNWPEGLGKAVIYHFSRWHGFTPSGEFDVVLGRDKALETRSWGEILKGLRAEKATSARAQTGASA